MISNITFSSSFKKQFRKYGENEKFKKKWKKFYNELLSRELVDLHPQWKNHKL
jgi:mRNA-degrading endonuclease YafQ of YafQ-DinJ toxin-antitoxin module